MIFPAVTNYLHNLQAVVPHIGEVKQIHTHKGPSDKALFLHTAPSVISTTPSPPLFHKEDAPEKYQFSNYSSNIYLHLCVPLFNFSVSCSSEIQFCMIYLETWGSTQPYVAFSTLDFRSFSLSLAEHTCHRILLHCISQCLNSMMVIQASTLPGLSHVIARTGSGLNC